jgi:hypothetical protein
VTHLLTDELHRFLDAVHRPRSKGSRSCPSSEDTSARGIVERRFIENARPSRGLFAARIETEGISLRRRDVFD